ncbi:AAA family ATPase [Thermodesulfobacteriota bacterium]
MARRSNDKLLYMAFQKFLDLCLIKNKSILWPDLEAWTQERVNDVKKRMVDSPISGASLSFQEKLKEQMKDAPPEYWAIICDTYYVYFLPSDFIKLETKQKDIRWAAEQGGLPLPANTSDIWEAQKTGFTRTGQKYHLKYAQFWFILLFSYRVKGFENPQTILSNANEMQKVLDETLNNIPNKADRAHDMKNAFQYLAFPDFYERIISNEDKKRIFKRYRDRIEGPIPLDIDEAILKIREVLSINNDKQDRLFDFYQDLRNEWRPGKDSAISFWWVNQGDSYTKNRGQKFLYAPHEGKGGKIPAHWANMKKVKKGDIIFNYANKHVQALSMAKDSGYDFVDEESEKWPKEGTRVDIDHYVIEKMPHTDIMDNMVDFKKALDGAKGPFNKNGNVNEGYLFEFNQNAAQIIRNIYGNPFPEPIEIYFDPKTPPPNNIWKGIKDGLSIKNLEQTLSINALYFENKEQLQSRIKTALRNGDHIMLIGPPGTGKSKLAKIICEFYCGNENYFMSTATSDWSTFETIGGYRPDSDGLLKYYPGIFLQCFQDRNKKPINKWLIIDEINRADIDKAFGSLFSALTGDDISLPFELNGEPLQIIGTPTDETKIKENLFIMPPDWRIIATMNTFDKASLYEMSYAFMRRFAFIPIDVPRKISVDLLKKYLEIWNLEINDEICSCLSIIWENINKRRKVGPAIIEDMYRYILDTNPQDYSSAIIMYILPQFEGLMEDDQVDFIKDMLALDFMNNSEELINFASDFFGIDIVKFG